MAVWQSEQPKTLLTTKLHSDEDVTPLWRSPAILVVFGAPINAKFALLNNLYVNFVIECWIQIMYNKNFEKIYEWS